MRPKRQEILKRAFAIATGQPATPWVSATEAKEEQALEKQTMDTKREVYLSKTLTWVLRHKAQDLGLTLDSEGYAPVSQVLQLRQLAGVTLEELQYVVAHNDKQRFALRKSQPPTPAGPTGSSGPAAAAGAETWSIRANQGHSKAVGSVIDDVKLLRKLTAPLPVCFHGTYQRHVQKIKKEGLKAMSRKHIHLTTSLDAKSGIRADVQCLVHIDMALALKDGIAFYVSDNGVVLTEGIDGVLPSTYIAKIETRASQRS
jgi:2'-phosphotransferase